MRIDIPKDKAHPWKRLRPNRSSDAGATFVVEYVIDKCLVSKEDGKKGEYAKILKACTKGTRASQFIHPKRRRGLRF